MLRSRCTQGGLQGPPQLQLLKPLSSAWTEQNAQGNLCISVKVHDQMPWFFRPEASRRHL